MQPQQSINRFALDASVIGREALRFTPAGIPIIGCTLQHCAEVIEAGIARQVEMTVQAIAAGELSGTLNSCALGYTARFTGFLAPRRRHAKTLVFHITKLQAIEKD